MDVAESEDAAANALDEYLTESPLTREEWERMDAERLELLAANEALSAELAKRHKEVSAAYGMAIRKQKRIEELTEQLTEYSKMLKVMPFDGLSAYDVDTWKLRRAALLALWDRSTVTAGTVHGGRPMTLREVMDAEDSAPTGAGGNAKAFVCCEGVGQHAPGCTTVSADEGLCSQPCKHYPACQCDGRLTPTVTGAQE